MSFNNLFMGSKMQQKIPAIPLWEYTIATFRPRRVIELGTGSGAFSFYLYLLCTNYNIKFYTFDKYAPLMKASMHETDFIDHFYKENILGSRDTQRRISNMVARYGRTLIFCDNGHKIGEFKIFSRSLKHNDIIGIHDWGQIKIEQIQQYIDNESLLKLSEIDNNIRTLEPNTVTKFFICKRNTKD